jgi:hypothetical protein
MSRASLRQGSGLFRLRKELRVPHAILQSGYSRKRKQKHLRTGPFHVKGCFRYVDGFGLFGHYEQLEACCRAETPAFSVADKHPLSGRGYTLIPRLRPRRNGDGILTILR